jgi:hypothetical protein
VVKKTVKDTRELGKQNEKLKPIGFRKDTLHSKPRVVDEDKRQRAMDEFKAKSSKQATESYAPVLRVLKETTRINHAIAGAADAAVTHKSVPKAALKGIKNESDTSFSDVLKHAGVKNKTVRGVGGFALDVGTDPTTYLTLGAGSVAAKSAGAAAKSAEKTALKKGLTQEQAAKMAERARTQTERKGNQAKGVTVKLAGKEVPGVRKATATAGKPAKAAGRKVTPQKVRDAARSVAADVNPDVAPGGRREGDEPEGGAGDPYG